MGCLTINSLLLFGKKNSFWTWRKFAHLLLQRGLTKKGSCFGMKYLDQPIKNILLILILQVKKWVRGNIWYTHSFSVVQVWHFCVIFVTCQKKIILKWGLIKHPSRAKIFYTTELISSWYNSQTQILKPRNLLILTNRKVCAYTIHKILTSVAPRRRKIKILGKEKASLNRHGNQYTSDPSKDF